MGDVFLPPTDFYGEMRTPVDDNIGYQWMLLLQFAWAIAEFEGFFIEDSIAQKNNNPGNLRPIGASVGFQTFNTPEEGWERLLHQIKLNVSRKLTLREFFLGKPGVYAGYAPLGDNDPDVMANYINFVSDRLNIPLDVGLWNYFPDIVGIDPSIWMYHVFPS